MLQRARYVVGEGVDAVLSLGASAGDVGGGAGSEGAALVVGELAVPSLVDVRDTVGAKPGFPKGVLLMSDDGTVCTRAIAIISLE